MVDKSVASHMHERYQWYLSEGSISSFCHIYGSQPKSSTDRGETPMPHHCQDTHIVSAGTAAGYEG